MQGKEGTKEVAHLAGQLPPIVPLGNLNPLAALIDLVEAEPLHLKDLGKGNVPWEIREYNRQVVHVGCHALRNVFEWLVEHQVLTFEHKSDTDPKGKVSKWIQERYDDFTRVLARITANHWDSNVRQSTLASLMQLLTSVNQARTRGLGIQYAWPSTTWRHFVAELMNRDASHDVDDGTQVLKYAFETYVDKFDDLRYHYLKEVGSLLEHEKPSKAFVRNTLISFTLLKNMPLHTGGILTFMCALEAPAKTRKRILSEKQNGNVKRRKYGAADISDSDEEEEQEKATGIFDEPEEKSDSEEELNPHAGIEQLPPILTATGHRRVFQDALLDLLKNPVNVDDAKRLLSVLHRQIVPNMGHPHRLMDWLSDMVDEGGPTGLLALNGLFVLVQKHGLEYPNFYTKLYALLDRDVLFVRYRGRFFRLLDVFLSSTHLPAVLVASFIKRLSRLALTAPPPALVIIIPFVYNLLKRHPACLVLIHRPSVDSLSETGDNNIVSVKAQLVEEDPFKSDEVDPTKTDALNSSIWELAMCDSHYLASVSSLAKVFSEPMNKPSYDMEDFLDHTHSTIFADEVKRPLGKAAVGPMPPRRPMTDVFFPESPHVNESVDPVSDVWSS